MKHLIVLFLLMGLWNPGFSATVHRSIEMHGLFPAEQIASLQNITKDTLIFSRMDTVQQAEWRWGIFYPHRYRAPFVFPVYHQVVLSDFFGEQIMAVYANGYSGNPQQIGPYGPYPLRLRWTFFCFFFAIHCYVLCVLRKLLRWIHSDQRYVTIRRQRRETILSVLLTILLTSAILGWWVGTYFFLFFPLIYLIIIFLPARTWYSRLTRMEMSGD